MIKKVSLVILITILSLNLVSAQSLKFGHINSADLVQMMPGLKDADAELQKYQSELEDQLKSMMSEYKTKTDDYVAKEKLMSDAIKDVKQKEIADMEKRIQDFQQSGNDKVGAKKEELYTPILKRAEQAIKDVAKENGYSYVLDTSVGAVIYAQDSDDIMKLVKKKLNITDVPVTPGK